jgi:hypothetical protein
MDLKKEAITSVMDQRIRLRYLLRALRSFVTFVFQNRPVGRLQKESPRVKRGLLVAQTAASI